MQISPQFYVKCQNGIIPLILIISISLYFVKDVKRLRKHKNEACGGFSHLKQTIKSFFVHFAINLVKKG